MAGDSRKQPELFRSNLFSSPSSGLSLGLGGDTFSSPLSLAPALASASTGGDAGMSQCKKDLDIIIQLHETRFGL